MTHNTDGNLAALRDYERGQDALDAADQALEKARADLSDELFDLYVIGHAGVVAEMDDALACDDSLPGILRKALEQECKLPRHERGRASYAALERLVSDAADSIARRCDTVDECREWLD